ncbi:RNA-binding domain-containing protein [Heliocybe sulcata]|uniref:RNA-binding domain-containing protein n=1 Tax=Heliocybe sulcata TaxID=5364 RepID=A0A5C3MYZ8_9AGAM|nr:RNA-binding domain-containing protein [Heliocybe sulcata]
MQQDISHPPSRTVSPTSPSPAPALPSNDDIEAIIQLATSSSSPLPQKDTRTQLFVGNLPYRVRWQDLKDLFRKAGTVLRADVSLGPDNRSRGYGTVLLASAEDAGRAIDMFNGYNWQTRVLEVRLDRLPVDLDTLGPPTGAGTPNATLSSPFLAPAMDDYAFLDRPSSSGGTRSLFVGNVSHSALPFHCQWQDLKDLFRQAGTILRADVALGPDGRSRGFGTVSYATEADAERAVSMFNG